MIQSVTLPFLGTIYLGPVLGFALTLLWIVGITNAFNFIDGLDGLATGVALISTVALGFIAAMNGAVFVALLCTALAGSLIAFLIFNFHPARVFLGDTGSMFLGFTLATISLTGSMKTSGTVVFLAPFLALGLPICEVAVSMIRRLVRGLPVSVADSTHTHHRLLRRGFSQRRVALIMYAVAMAGLFAALLISATRSSQGNASLFLPLTIYAVAILAVGWLAGYARDTSRILETRKRNVFYHAFVNYATMSLSSDAGTLGVNSILEIARREMRLDFLSLSFLDPAEPIGTSRPRERAKGAPASDPVRELHVKSVNGERILIRYRHNGNSSELEREEILMHLGSIFEQATIKRSSLKTDAEPIRVEDDLAQTEEVAEPARATA